MWIYRLGLPVSPIRKASGGKIYTDQTTIYNLRDTTQRAIGGRTLIMENINFILKIESLYIPSIPLLSIHFI